MTCSHNHSCGCGSLSNANIKAVIEGLLITALDEKEFDVIELKNSIHNNLVSLGEVQDKLNDFKADMALNLSALLTKTELASIKLELETLIHQQQNVYEDLQRAFEATTNNKLLEYKSDVQDIQQDVAGQLNAVQRQLADLVPTRDAYKIAVQNGYVGSEASWLDSLKGHSAYTIAKAHGFRGSESEWLSSLKGDAGPRGPRGERGVTGARGVQGPIGAKGDNTYQIAKDHGYVGSEEEWLANILSDTDLFNNLTGYIDTIPSTVNDAINNTAVDGSVLADTFVTVTANNGTVPRTQRDKNSDIPSIKDFANVADAQAAAIAQGIKIFIPAGEHEYDLSNADMSLFWGEGHFKDVTTGLIMEPLNLSNISPEYFGAVGDGIADDSNAISKWLQAGGKLSLTAGKTYRVTKSSYGVANTYINGNGATILADFPKDSQIGSLNFYGDGASSSIKTTTTSNFSRSNKRSVISVPSTSGFKVGDRFRITSKQYKHGIDGKGGLGVKHRGEFSEIRSISSNSITLLESLKDDYTEGTKTIERFDFLDNVVVRNVNFVNAKGNATDTSIHDYAGVRGIRVRSVDFLYIDGCTFSNFRRFAGDITDSKNVVITGCKINGYDLKDPTNLPYANEWFTGIHCRSSENVVFSNNTGKNARRIFDVDSSPSSVFSRNIVISNNVAINCGQLVGTHACQYVLVENNVGHNCGAIWIRGIDVTIRGNRLEGLGDAQAKHQGIRIGFGGYSSEGYDFPVGKVVMTDNVLDGSTGWGLSVRGEADSIVMTGNTVRSRENSIEIIGKKTENVIITGNNLSSAARAVIRMPNLIVEPKEVLKNVLINGNILTNTNWGAGIAISGSSIESPADMIVITNNTFQGATIRSLGLSYSGSDDEQGFYGENVHISGNLFGENTSGEDDIVFKKEHMIHPSIGENALSKKFKPKKIGSVENGSFPSGYTYEKGMYALEENIEEGKPYAYICTRNGTIGRPELVASASTTADSNKVVLHSNNTPVPIGSYLVISGSGLTSNARVVGISGKTLTLSEDAKNTSNNADTVWSVPVFTPLGNAGSVSNGWGVTKIPENLEDLNKTNKPTGMYKYSPGSVGRPDFSSLGSVLYLRSGYQDVMQLAIDIWGNGIGYRSIGKENADVRWHQLMQEDKYVQSPNGHMMAMDKYASINLFADRITKNGPSSITDGVEVEFVGTGDYVIVNAKLSGGWWNVETYKDNNGQPFYDIEVKNSTRPNSEVTENIITVKTFEVGTEIPTDIRGHVLIRIDK